MGCRYDHRNVVLFQQGRTLFCVVAADDDDLQLLFHREGNRVFNFSCPIGANHHGHVASDHFSHRFESAVEGGTVFGLAAAFMVSLGHFEELH